MAGRKRTSLDKEISRLQKNTRNKIYRLRKNGADVSTIDPRLSTRDMTGSQKAAYARRLRNFNSRPNSYIIQENSVPVTRRALAEFKAVQSQVNVKRGEIRAKVNKLKEITENELPVESLSNATANFNPYTGRFQRARGALANDLMDIEKYEPFTSQAQLEREIQSVKRQARTQTLKRSNKVLKDNIYAMLESANRPDLAEKSKLLNNAQRNYLLYRTNFLQSVAMVSQTPKSKNDGTLSQSELDAYDEWLKEIEYQLDAVQVITNRYTIRK